MKVLQVYVQHGKAALDRPFSYLYAGDKEVDVGFRVLISFHGQKIVGYVSEVYETSQTKEEFDQANGFKTSFIDDVIDIEPLLNDELMKLVDEVSSYYISPRISVLQAMLPSSLRPSISAMRGPKIAYEKWVEIVDSSEEGLTSDKQKELLRLIADNSPVLKKDCKSISSLDKLVEFGKVKIVLKEKERFHIPDFEKEQPHDLTIDQRKAFDYIVSTDKKTILLQGVTGSGKTEVYLALAEKVLSEGKNILMMVPEISLTPRMVEYFGRRFEGNIAILHSELTPAEKYDEYRRIARGEARIVVGARSAVFAPLDNVGLIILDEEHVESYKQDKSPYYHARDVAIMRAKHFDSKVVLGSATPSLETKARAVKGVYGYTCLPKRISDKGLPKTSIIDLSRSRSYPGSRIFSLELGSKIKEKLSRNEQIMLLINKRGYSSSLNCPKCGYIFECPNCHNHLTFHKKDNMLKCHRCDYVSEYPAICPQCGNEGLRRVGFGTERIVKEINDIFPEAKVDRLDSDIAAVRNTTAKILQRFKDREFDILVGTQMIAKGHDFPNVTLVGVVMADIGLSLPTYRSSERTFELIAQAVGRAGRAEKAGEAIIQTYNPTNYAITLGASQDYEKFYAKEMETRRNSQFPPYTYLVNMKFRGGVEEKVVQASFDVKTNFIRQGYEKTDALGPITPYVNFVADTYEKDVLFKFKSPSEVVPYIKQIVKDLSGKGGIDINCDVDPLDC
ncbi:MAG: primosomal protein N' [Bacilli bacterium]|nr:primosomal protein N' [Bacilli bacterium]